MEREVTNGTDDEGLENVTPKPNNERGGSGNDELNLANDENGDLLTEVGLVRVGLAGTLVLRKSNGLPELGGVVRGLLRRLRVDPVVSAVNVVAEFEPRD